MVMKNKWYLLLILVVTFLPLNIYAYDIQCESGPFSFEDYFYCHVTGVANTNYEELSGTITNTDFVSCVYNSYSDGLRENSTSDNKSFNLAGTPKSENLVTYRCQVVAKVSTPVQDQVTINNFRYHITNDSPADTAYVLRSNQIELAEYTETTTTKATDDKPRDTSNGNSLLSRLESEELDITFSRFITEYNVEVLYEVESININATPANSDATVTITGNENLQVGRNVIDITVVSPDNASTTVYSIYVNRLPRGETVYYPESDASLFSLSVPGYSIPFESGIFEYTIHLEDDVDSIEVNAEPTYENAIVSISNTNNLTNGSIVTITVTSEDNTNSQRYRINITKDPEKRDYTSLIIIIAFVAAIIIFIVIFIITAQRKNNDPILKVKKEKRKVHKGAKFNPKSVPEASETPIKKEDSKVNSNESKPIDMPAPKSNSSQPQAVQMPSPKQNADSPLPTPMPTPATSKSEDENIDFLELDD